MDDCKWHILKRRNTEEDFFLNQILQTRHSWNAVPVQNNSWCGAVDLWSTYANLQTHVHRHVVYTQTERLYNITPLGVRKPKKPPREVWPQGVTALRVSAGIIVLICT